MKSIEKDVLFRQKIKEGLDEDMANFEIARDEFFEKKTKQDWKDLKNNVKSLSHENHRLKKIINKNMVPKEFNINNKMNEIKNNKSEIATVKDLNRIISLIEVERRIGLDDLTKTCVLNSRVCKSALNFLIKNNIIRQINDGRKVILEKI